MTETTQMPGGRPPGFRHKMWSPDHLVLRGGRRIRFGAPVGGLLTVDGSPAPAAKATFVVDDKLQPGPPPRPPGPDLDDPIALLRQGAEAVVLLDQGRYVPAPLRRAADRAAAAAARALDVREPTVRWYAGKGDPAWAPAHAFGRVSPARLAAPLGARAFFDLAGPAAVYLRLAAAGSPWEAATSAAHELAHAWHLSVLGAGKMARASAAQLAALEDDAQRFAAALVAQSGDELIGEDGG